MKKGLALVSVLGLVVAFQNCSQETLSSSSDSFKATDVTVNLSEQSSTPSKISFVEIPNIQAENAQSRMAQSRLDSAGNYRLVISVESGAMQILDDSNAPIDKGCLPQSDLQELHTILSGSKICQNKVVTEDMCAQVHRPGYAALYADDERINLGEEKDSCGTGKVDLCGELSKVFKAYVAHLRMNWPQMSCEK